MKVKNKKLVNFFVCKLNSIFFSCIRFGCCVYRCKILVTQPSVNPSPGNRCYAFCTGAVPSVNFTSVIGTCTHFGHSGFSSKKQGFCCVALIKTLSYDLVGFLL